MRIYDHNLKKISSIINKYSQQLILFVQKYRKQIQNNSNIVFYQVSYIVTFIKQFQIDQYIRYQLFFILSQNIYIQSKSMQQKPQQDNIIIFHENKNKNNKMRHRHTSEPSFDNFLKNQNPNLFTLLTQMPTKTKEVLHESRTLLTKKINRNTYIKKVFESKKKMYDKFSIIRKSIERKMQSKFISNDEIIKECQSLNIKNIGRKYSEYKIKENLEEMQERIKVSKMSRSKSSNVSYCFKRKLTLSKPHKNVQKREIQKIEETVIIADLPTPTSLTTTTFYEQFKINHPKIDFFDTHFTNDILTSQLPSRITSNKTNNYSSHKTNTMRNNNKNEPLTHHHRQSIDIQQCKDENPSKMRDNQTFSTETQEEDLFQKYSKFIVNDNGKIVLNPSLQNYHRMNLESQIKNMYQLIRKEISKR